MSQNDFSLADGNGAAVRSDLNSALQALASRSSGTGAPSTAYAFQYWEDTTTSLLKERNAANNAWLTVGSQGTGGFVPYHNGYSMGSTGTGGFAPTHNGNDMDPAVKSLGTATLGTGDYISFSPSGTGASKRAPIGSVLTASLFTSSYDSGTKTITAGGSLTLAHSLGTQPKLVTFALKSLGTEAGYSVGDEALPLPGDQGSHKGFVCVPDGTNLNIRFGSAGNTFNLVNKTTGADTVLNNGSWAFIARAWA